MTTISIIVGSTRQGRFSEKPAQWILEHLRQRDRIEGRLLDLRDFPMPFFDQAVPPAMPGRAPYEHDIVQKWTAAIGAWDGFIFVTPEYNYGPSAVLKNAIDWVYPEWNRKAATFVSYAAAPWAPEVSSSFARRPSSFRWHPFNPPSTFPRQRFVLISRAETWKRGSPNWRSKRLG